MMIQYSEFQKSPIPRHLRRVRMSSIRLLVQDPINTLPPSGVRFQQVVSSYCLLDGNVLHLGPRFETSYLFVRRNKATAAKKLWTQPIYWSALVMPVLWCSHSFCLLLIDWKDVKCQGKQDANHSYIVILWICCQRVERTEHHWKVRSFWFHLWPGPKRHGMPYGGLWPARSATSRLKIFKRLDKKK